MDLVRKLFMTHVNLATMANELDRENQRLVTWDVVQNGLFELQWQKTLWQKTSLPFIYSTNMADTGISSG